MNTTVGVGHWAQMDCSGRWVDRCHCGTLRALVDGTEVPCCFDETRSETQCDTVSHIHCAQPAVYSVFKIIFSSIYLFI